MSKSKSRSSKPKRKRKRGFPPAAEEPKPQKHAPSIDSPNRPRTKWGLVALFLMISIGGCYLFLFLLPKNERFTYEVLTTYPHDPTSFTQGILIDDGFVWESTGRYGESKLRKYELGKSEILLEKKLDDDYFGEGLTILGDKIYQLTWKAGKAFVYDRDFNKIKEFEYEGQGWGLTSDPDANELIFSDGSAEIKFLDPETFEEKRSIWVKKKGGLRVGNLNELEFYKGRIYANKYQSDWVYEINPENGLITKMIDLSGLWPTKERPADGVLNGIAINPDTKKFLFTGKLSPTIYECSVFPQETK